MTVTIDELAQDERKQHRFLGTATLGEGTKKVLGIHTDRDTAMQIAQQRAQKAERALAAVEVHDPGSMNLSPSEGMRMLKDPAGAIVEVPLSVVEALLAVGYGPADMPETDPFKAINPPPLGLSSAGMAQEHRHPLEDATDEPAPRRRPGRPPKQQQPTDE